MPTKGVILVDYTDQGRRAIKGHARLGAREVKEFPWPVCGESLSSA